MPRRTRASGRKRRVRTRRKGRTAIRSSHGGAPSRWRRSARHFLTGPVASRRARKADKRRRAGALQTLLGASSGELFISNKHKRELIILAKGQLYASLDSRSLEAQLEKLMEEQTALVLKKKLLSRTVDEASYERLNIVRKDLERVKRAARLFLEYAYGVVDPERPRMVEYEEKLDNLPWTPSVRATLLGRVARTLEEEDPRSGEAKRRSFEKWYATYGALVDAKADLLETR